MINLESQHKINEEALSSLKNIKENKVWICTSDMFISFPKSIFNFIYNFLIEIIQIYLYIEVAGFQKAKFHNNILVGCVCSSMVQEDCDFLFFMFFGIIYMFIHVNVDLLWLYNLFYFISKDFYKVFIFVVDFLFSFFKFNFFFSFFDPCYIMQQAF